jgi:hypothetical protein
MFFAVNTPKRGFSTRKCKESAQMASLNTSPMAVRAFVPGACPALASGAPRPAARHSWGRGMALRAAALVLVMLGLGVVGALPTAVQAKALASASVEIKNLIWYRADGSSPDPSNDLVITTLFENAPQVPVDTTQRGGSEFFEFAGDLDGNSYNRPRDNRTSFETQMVGPVCVGAGCPGPGDLNPSVPPPTGDFASNYGQVDGFYSNIIDAPNPITPGGLVQGLRSDVSLASEDLSGSSTAKWDSSMLLDSDGTFDTYFVIEFEAHAMAFAEGPEDSAAANVRSFISVSAGGNSLNDRWFFLDLSSSGGLSTLSDKLNSYDELGRFIELVPFEFGDPSYTVRVVAESSVGASTSSSAVPLPGVLWLLGIGLASLIATRALLGRRKPLVRGPQAFE